LLLLVAAAVAITCFIAVAIAGVAGAILAFATNESTLLLIELLAVDQRSEAVMLTREHNFILLAELLSASQLIGRY
jgi:hypothetical protein